MIMNNHVDSIYESITKKEILKIFLAGSLIGIIVFLVCYGWKILDVTNDSWLLTGQDISQHYIGWKFYRASSWHFPIGQIDGLLYPDTSCIIFTDSIPILAIFFKILSPILPETFQYFGIWGFLTYFLIGGISAIIIRKSTDRCYLCWLGSGFFCLSPYVFQRMYGHTALAGHWIILLALLVWIYRPFFSTFRRKLGAWTFTLVIGSLVHIYFIPMILVFMCGFCIQDLLEKKNWKEDLLFVSMTIMIDLFVLYIVGAFSKSGSFSDEGLGLYSANLNSLINPNNYAHYLQTLPIRDGQDEGFGYLGLGMLLLLGCVLGLAIINKFWKIKKDKDSVAFQCSIGIVLMIFFILAWSPEIVFGTKTILKIPYPPFVVEALSTFRASGRFIWCVGYIIMIYGIMSVCQWSIKKVAYICMISTLIIQLADLRWIMQSKKGLVNAPNQLSSMQSDEWEVLAKGKEYLIILPHDTVKSAYGIAASYEMGNFAVEHGLKVNYFPVARANEIQLAINDAQYVHNLLNGVDSDINLYILDTPERGIEYGLEIYSVDGYFVGIKSKGEEESDYGRKAISYNAGLQ